MSSMRLYITKKHHQQMLIDLAKRLGSGSPADALEHIMNCWVVLPPPSTQQAPPVPAADDPMAGLVEF
jgi:hypothetical protein